MLNSDYFNADQIEDKNYLNRLLETRARALEEECMRIK